MEGKVSSREYLSMNYRRFEIKKSASIIPYIFYAILMYLRLHNLVAKYIIAIFHHKWFSWDFWKKSLVEKFYTP